MWRRRGIGKMPLYLTISYEFMPHSRTILKLFVRTTNPEDQHGVRNGIEQQGPTRPSVRDPESRPVLWQDRDFGSGRGTAVPERSQESRLCSCGTPRR